LLGDAFRGSFTGKVTLITKYDEHHDQYLEINIERKRGIEADASLEAALVPHIVAHLREKSSEFRELSDFLGDRATPRLVFWPYEYPRYFKPGIKQPWVMRESAP
jgi:hypothetical protein